ncbi:MAG: transketolase [Spirochaetales bacterium]|nr:transketolase [Spirochaetales bacterium]
MDREKLEFLESKALEIRKETIEMIGYLGVGHIGGAMSIVEILTILYYDKMNVDSGNPRMKERDKLVLSKGHAGPTLYATLADKGFFPKEWLHTLNNGGTNLPSHCDMNRTPGIDMTTGSLGQGLSAAIGLALANRMDKVDSTIFAIIGDGESNEGQVWEAAMAAPHYGLDRLIAFTDANKMQIDGYTKDVMGLGDLKAKWESFGWHTIQIDGHDLNALSDAIDAGRAETTKPTMIVCDTIKGKGCSFAEGVLSNHNMAYTYDQAKDAIAALES